MPCNGLLISHSKHRERLLHASFSALICAKLDELIPFACHLMHWLFIGMAGNKNQQINKILILISIKNSLTYYWIQLTLKFLGSFPVKCPHTEASSCWPPVITTAFSLTIFRLLCLHHLSCLKWNENRPIWRGEAVSVFRSEVEGEDGRSHHLVLTVHDRSCCLIKMHMHNT